MPKMKCRDGTSLFFQVSGEGNPLVLIAGGFCDHHVWDDILDVLSEKYRVITYDHRGIGQSDAPFGSYTVDLLANDLKDLLNYLQISSVHIIGHSMGGFIAQYFSAFYPERTLSLSLLSSLLVMNSSGNDYLNTVVDGLQKNPDRFRQEMPEAAGRSQAMHSILQQIELCKKHDARPYIHKINAPTLIVSGLKELVVSKEESQLLASAIQNVRQTIFLNCDHMLQRECPLELSSVLLHFLNPYIIRSSLFFNSANPSSSEGAKLTAKL